MKKTLSYIVLQKKQQTENNNDCIPIKISSVILEFHG